MKKLLYFTPSFLMLAVAANVNAADVNLGYLSTAFTGLTTLINSVLVPLLFAFALLMFFWGVVQYFILGADDEGKRETGRAYMLYSILGLVAITAVWGIVSIVTTLFGVQGGTAPAIPGAPTAG